MRKVLCAFLVLVAGAASPAAQVQRGGISQAERQQQISKLIEDINGPDPAARISAYETAVSGTDRVLQRIAIQQGLSSSEQIIRESALKATFVDRGSLSLEVATLPQGATEPEIAAASAIGGNLGLLVSGFDATTGAFNVASPMGPAECSGSGPQYKAQPANLSGDRISFSISLRRGCTSQPEWTFQVKDIDGSLFMRACNGAMRLDENGTLAGSMSCQSRTTNFRFRISASVLN